MRKISFFLIRNISVGVKLTYTAGRPLIVFWFFSQQICELGVLVFRKRFLFKVSWIYADRSSPLSVGDVLITQNPRIRVSSDLDGTWSLHIRNVQRTDAGTYMCQINTEPATKQNVYLSVLGKYYHRSVVCK